MLAPPRPPASAPALAEAPDNVLDSPVLDALKPIVMGHHQDFIETEKTICAALNIDIPTRRSRSAMVAAKKSCRQHFLELDLCNDKLGMWLDSVGAVFSDPYKHMTTVFE